MVFRKVKAFTLLETLIAMILTTIVIGFSIGIIVLLNRNMHFIEENYKKQTNVNLLGQQIEIDFYKASRLIIENGEELELISPIEKTNYSLSSKAIIRNNDTIFKSHYTISYLFLLNGERVINGNIDALKIVLDSSGLSNKKLFVSSLEDTSKYLIQNGN